MDYFKLYNIPVGFKVDKKVLKRTFYANSRQYHPDFHTDKTEEEQARILELSTLNNEAYRVLSDPDLRMKYILDQKGLLQEGKDKLPQDFLMKMMDINEQLMELEFDPNPQALSQAQQAVNELSTAIHSGVSEILEHYDDKKVTEGELSEVKNYYLKRRYILRIQENLHKFASA